MMTDREQDVLREESAGDGSEGVDGPFVEPVDARAIHDGGKSLRPIAQSCTHRREAKDNLAGQRTT